MQLNRIVKPEQGPGLEGEVLTLTGMGGSCNEGQLAVALNCEAVELTRFQLLKQRVLDPEVDVSLPVPLLSSWRHVGNRMLIHLHCRAMQA